MHLLFSFQWTSNTDFCFLGICNHVINLHIFKKYACNFPLVLSSFLNALAPYEWSLPLWLCPLLFSFLHSWRQTVIANRLKSVRCIAFATLEFLGTGPWHQYLLKLCEILLAKIYCLENAGLISTHCLFSFIFHYFQFI